MDFREAIRRHTEWKVRFRMAIFRKEQLDAAKIGRDDCCLLGEWLHGAGAERAGTLPEFCAALATHKAFHEEAGRIATLINAGRYAEAEQALADDSPYGANSARTLASLDALQKISDF